MAIEALCGNRKLCRICVAARRLCVAVEGFE